MKVKVTERHIAALNLLGYAIILTDPRVTTGTIGFMLANYSRTFVLFLALWAWFGVLYLLWRKSSAVSIAAASMPIFAYAIMGLWFVLFGHQAPIAAFILPCTSTITIIWLVHTRIQAMREGWHDDTVLPDISDSPK